jgi:hypothetical protein
MDPVLTPEGSIPCAAPEPPEIGAPGRRDVLPAMRDLRGERGRAFPSTVPAVRRRVDPVQTLGVAPVRRSTTVRATAVVKIGLPGAPIRRLDPSIAPARLPAPTGSLPSVVAIGKDPRTSGCPGAITTV